MKHEPFHLLTNGILQLETKSPAVAAGFTTRTDGIGKPPYESRNTAFHVGEDNNTTINNRMITARHINRPLSTWIAEEQVHGSRIVEVGQSDAGKGSEQRETAVAEADGLITQSKDVTLVSFYADCVPLFFYTESSAVAGLAHAGWKGTAADIGGEMVRAFIEKGVPVEQMYAAIGPSISGANYEVNEAVIQSFQDKEVFLYHKPWIQKANGRYELDLKTANRLLLERAGIAPERIVVSRYCTYAEEELFFSHRRENGKTGRMMSYIYII
ncbi:laccase domain-containing protein [Marinococcus halophilus]|uniref:Purine nucleoside phosphorylase n=1 Tax=Marinococcus halophilus TaxID=1371 RepID=A0A510Y1Y1_MARHA|nr:peptidoglycan editing factor PgeF [Marinococcus halophilus]OZT81369.1 laccase domain-containing protein [Marinococcus halophilus]GEK57320.1 laccase domain protein YlmD [Marinococcus halophilus]